MTGNAQGLGKRGIGRRLGGWAVVTALVLMVPLVAMRFSSEVNWTGFDFVFAAVLIFGSGAAFELLTRRTGNIAYRAGAALAILATFLLLWVNGAVGIIGSEDDEANLLYFGVPAIALLGALTTGFRPAGMAGAMLVAGIAQVAIGATAVIAGWGSDGPIWPRDVIGATAMFGALWLLSAGLFRKAARGRTAQDSYP